MRKKIDITGQRFGRLIAVQEVSSKGHHRCYLCTCDCGNTKIVPMDNLRNGKTKSCGCLNREMTSSKNTIDLTGKRFGRLTVLRRSGGHHKTQTKAIWTCQCDCGNVVDVLSTNLTRGETKSCSCWKKDNGYALFQYDRSHLLVDGVFFPLLKSRVRFDNPTGVKGITIDRASGKYRASITIRRKRIYLGRYAKLQDAVRARKIAEDIYHKPYLEG
ncbi:hypothetical protein E4665_03195 [Sporolactobacillus shoreae]|uniref:AP2 domain-containing protein n=1 Tax=Sporolactobacillus shoreae TaxID=1465501 RepID=A0A4Z0GRM6_9BACL|nr:hypothetical protein [Sporolactobacillus shoreae]TGA99969.1 hypothetical protein E4665_03195 [Sporolactobacillus shoreae]